MVFRKELEERLVFPRHFRRRQAKTLDPFRKLSGGDVSQSPEPAALGENGGQLCQCVSVSAEDDPDDPKGRSVFREFAGSSLAAKGCEEMVRHPVSGVEGGHKDPP